MYQICYNCKNLTTFDISKWQTTSALTNMATMFTNCEKLVTLDFGGFHTENVTTMADMVANCYSLKSINVSSFNTSNVVSMWHMFASTRSLTTLDLSSWDTRKVKDMVNMFINTTSLKVIYAGPNWTTETAHANDKAKASYADDFYVLGDYGMFTNSGVSDVTRV